MIEGFETGCSEPQKTIQLGLFCLDAKKAQFQLIFSPATFTSNIFDTFNKVKMHQKSSTLERLLNMQRHLNK